jgi:hypothetical protein
MDFNFQNTKLQNLVQKHKCIEQSCSFLELLSNICFKHNFKKIFEWAF